jgi:outer membrane protein assembly factor BamB
LSDSHQSSSSSAEPGPLVRVSSTGSSDHNLCSQILLRGWRNLAGRPGRRGSRNRVSSYRPLGEGLESKALLSNVLGWNGGSGGTQNSPITSANISQLTQQYTDVVDGAIIAEPLVATVNITVGPTQGTQSVVFVATQHDSLYAFNATTGQLAWHTSFLTPSEMTLPLSEQAFQGSGIVGTPAIELSTNSIYLVSSECYVVGNVTHYTKTLHAIDMSNGTERAGSPAVIADTGYVGNTAVSFAGPVVRGRGAGSVRGRIHFNVLREMQRPGLTIDGNNLVFGFGSAFGVAPYYHGWILAFNKSSLQPTGVFNDTPNGHNGGIWNDGNPIQVDSQGFLYTATGNGTFDAKLNARGFPSRGDFGDTVLKLALKPRYKGPNGTGIRVVDYFTPHNQAKLDKYDEDLASSGVLILPDGLGGRKHPNLLLASGKLGTLYVINRNNMGHFRVQSDKIVEEMRDAITSSFDTPAYSQNTVYYAGAGDVLKSFVFANGHLTPAGHSLNTFSAHGASPVYSSNGAQNGIVWVISSSKQLIAYSDTNLSSELWSANLPGYSTFSIANVTGDGHVIVGAGRTVVGFGLGAPA